MVYSLVRCTQYTSLWPPRTKGSPRRRAIGDRRPLPERPRRDTRQAHNIEAERRAVQIRLRAERKAGQLLKEMEKAKASRGNQYTGKVDRSDDTTGPKTLRELGISKDQSSQWQKLAAVPGNSCNFDYL
jgi:hypothetical protein